MDAIESPRTKLDRHESLRGKRTFERLRFLRGETESRIVVGMPDDDGDLLTSISQQLQSMVNQLSAYTPALMLWKDGHGRQRNRGNQRPGLAPNPHPAEQDVADETSIKLSHQRNKRLAIGAQPVH